MSFTKAFRQSFPALALAALAAFPLTGAAEDAPAAIRIESWTARPTFTATTDEARTAQPAIFTGYADDQPGHACTAPATITNTCGCNNQPAFSGRIIPYMWLPGQTGSVTVRGSTAHVDASISRVWDILVHDLDFAAMGQVEAYYGDFGIIFNGDYYRVSPGGRVNGVNFTGHFAQTILDLALTYNLVGGCDKLPCGTRLELLAGVRYNAVSASLTIVDPINGTVSAEGTKEWMDPIVGGRLRLPIGDSFAAVVRGDVGGFDLPQASRFTWNIEAMLEYRMTDRCSLVGGWRWLDIDRQRGDGKTKFGYDILLSGPVAGLAIGF